MDPLRGSIKTGEPARLSDPAEAAIRHLDGKRETAHHTYARRERAPYLVVPEIEGPKR